MAKLYILSGPDKGQSFEVGRDPVYVGRSAHNTIKMSDKAVSRRHLKILMRGNRYFIKDLESENGTFISGKEVSGGVDIEVAEGVHRYWYDRNLSGGTLLGECEACSGFHGAFNEDQ